MIFIVSPIFLGIIFS